MRRLQELRGRLLDDLLGTLAWVRELVTMIHLAKFSGAPASGAEELVSQIAAAVEGLSEASSWVETATTRGPDESIVAHGDRVPAWSIRDSTASARLQTGPRECS